MNNSNAVIINSVLPDDVQSILAAYAADETHCLWKIGYMARDLAAELPIKHALLDQAIAQCCQWRASRARDVRSVATFYPEETIAKFPTLSFSHHRCAMSAGTLEKSVAWLEWCLSSSDEYGGRIAPVDVLAAKMQAAGAKVAAPVWEKWLALVNRTLRKLYLHPSTPPNVSEAVGRVLSVFEHEFPEAAE